MFENDTSRQDAMQTNEKTSNRDEVMGFLQMKPDSNKPLNIRKNFLEILRHDFLADGFLQFDYKINRINTIQFKLLKKLAFRFDFLWLNLKKRG